MNIYPTFPGEPVYPLPTHAKDARVLAEQYVQIIRNNTRGEKIVVVGTGTSGATLGVLMQMIDPEITYVHVSKPDEQTHRWDSTGAYNSRPSDSWWIVDDLVSSGATIVNILDSLATFTETIRPSRIAGIIAAANIDKTVNIHKKSTFEIDSFYY